jgi:hypothetical protein
MRDWQLAVHGNPRNMGQDAERPDSSARTQASPRQILFQSSAATTKTSTAAVFAFA